MGVFFRHDSPVWWLYLESTHQKERTDIRVGHTSTQRRDSRKLAEERYFQRMNEVAARLYKLPSAAPAIRFGRYAETYARDVIVHHRGSRRERELLVPLRAFLDDVLLAQIDQDVVRRYLTHRTATVAAVTANREVDLLKAMLRDAVPKYLAVSPLVGMKRLRPLTPKRRLMTAAEEGKLLAVGDAVDRALIILGLDTLMRLGDLLDLSRSDRDGHWLYVKDPKSGHPYEVALSPRAEQALGALPKDEPFYFAKFRRAKNPRDWTGSARQRLEFLCRKAHVRYGQKRGGITFHWATRRTGATRLLMDRRVPVPVVQKQGNWKTPDVLLAIYADARSDDQLRAVGHTVKTRRQHG